MRGRAGARLDGCCRDLFCRLKLPRIVAVFVALGVAFAVLGVLGFIVADSVRTFASKADSYSQRVEELLGWAIGFMEEARPTCASASG